MCPKQNPKCVKPELTAGEADSSAATVGSLGSRRQHWMGGQGEPREKLGSNAAISQTDPVMSGEAPSAGGKGDSRVLNLVSVYLFRILRQGSLSPQLELCLPWWQRGVAEQG